MALNFSRWRRAFDDVRTRMAESSEEAPPEAKSLFNLWDGIMLGAPLGFGMHGVGMESEGCEMPRSDARWDFLKP